VDPYSLEVSTIDDKNWYPKTAMIEQDVLDPKFVIPKDKYDLIYMDVGWDRKEDSDYEILDLIRRAVSNIRSAKCSITKFYYDSSFDYYSYFLSLADEYYLSIVKPPSSFHSNDEFYVISASRFEACDGDCQHL
jgi:hypothetical protein